MTDLILALDLKIFFWVNKTIANPIFDWLMPFITDENHWIFPILILFFYLGVLSGKRGRITLVILILALGITDSISAFVLKPYFARIRPSHILQDSINILVSKGGKWSMPSNHSANMFALAVVISYFYEKIKIPTFILATSIAFSRVYVGVHYPGDVVVGAFLGYGFAWLVLTLWVILKMRELKRGQTWIWYEGAPPK